VIVVVLLGLQLLRLSDIIVRFDLDLLSIGFMLSGLALSFTPLVFPIAVLFSSLSFFGRLSSDRELVALYSIGYSPKRILRPAMLFAFIAMIATILASMYLGPYGNRRFEASIDEAFKKRVTTALRSGTFSEGFLGMVIFVDRINPVNQILERVFIHDESSFQDHVSISAKQGHWGQSLSEGVGILKLKEGILISQIPEKQIVRRIEFDEYTVHADFSRQIGQSRDSPPSLGLTQLLVKRAEHKLTGEGDPRSIWVEIARRVALSFACLFFVPLAFFLSVDESRMAKSRAVFFGIVVLLSYWTVYFALVTWLLKTPFEITKLYESVSWFVIWVPNFIVVVFSYIFYRLRVRYRVPSS